MAIPTNKPQNRILLVGGIVFALLAGLVVFLAVSKSAGNPTAQTPTVSVVVAATSISAGTQLSASELTTHPYLQEDVPAGSFTAAGQILGKTLPVTVTAGTPITQQLLGSSSGTGSTSLPGAPSQLPIAANDVALSIPAHTGDTSVDQMTVGYYVQAGDHIDILADLGGPTATSHQVQYVFQDIPVLAVGYASTSTAAPANGSPTPAATPALQAPSFFVVEMTRSQAEQMTALLTGKFAPTSSGNAPVALKYVLRPTSEYGQTDKSGNYNPKIESSTGTTIPPASDQPVTPQSLAGAFATS